MKKGRNPRSYILKDECGYWERRQASNLPQALRMASNLADTASVEYATKKFVCLGGRKTDAQIERHNAIVAKRLSVY